jgi:hypothetical protein
MRFQGLGVIKLPQSYSLKGGSDSGKALGGREKY